MLIGLTSLDHSLGQISQLSYSHLKPHFDRLVWTAHVVYNHAQEQLWGKKLTLKLLNLFLQLQTVVVQLKTFINQLPHNEVFIDAFWVSIAVLN